MIEVELNPYEVELARRVAELRTRDLKAEGRWRSFGPDTEERGVLAACAELGVAKLLDVYWTGAACRARHDVGGYEVRHTPIRSGALFARVPVAERYLLVVGEGQLFSIVGGIDGARAQLYEASDPGHRGRPAHVVPQSQLYPLRLGRVEGRPALLVDLPAEEPPEWMRPSPARVAA